MKAIAIWNQNCIRAGEECQPNSNPRSPSAFPMGDVTAYAFSEERAVVSYVRTLFRRAKREGGGNGAYMRKVARNLHRGILFATDLDALEITGDDGGPRTLTPKDCAVLD